MIKFDIMKRFGGGVQFTAEIDCDESDLTSVKAGLAVKWGIKSGADLRGADLRGAYLRGADLQGAYLQGAYLIHCGTRSDGWEFFAHMSGNKIWIKAGCRYFNITDAAKHWRDTRNGTSLGKESQQLLKNARALVKIRGLK